MDLEGWSSRLKVFADATRVRLAEARAKESNLPAGDKERAELVAGLAAYALKNPTVASTYLKPLTSNADRQVSGRARWTLGQIEAERGNHADAAPAHRENRQHGKNGDDSQKAGVEMHADREQ